MARWLLPWFGGAASVWTTSMLFFQTLLLVGYLYSHHVATRLAPRSQSRLHLGLLAVAVVALGLTARAWPSPITPGSAWRPQTVDAPIPHLLFLLAVSVGLPFLVLSTTGPLLQVWFSRLRPGSSPYRLYALSNAGSLLGVLLYPIAVEPTLALPAQGWAFAALFVLYALCVTSAAVAQARRGTLEPTVPASPADAPEQSQGRGQGVVAAPVLWWSLPALTSLALLAVTNQLTLDVAVIPFLWMAPLAVYLATFIWAFSGPCRFPRRVWGPLLVAASVASGAALFVGTALPVTVQVAIHAFFLLTLCAFGHGELAARKPAVSRLTAYYLGIAGGGALGGFVAAVVAPVAFRGLWELPIAIYGGLLMLAVAVFSDRSGWAFATARRERFALSAAGVALFGAALGLAYPQERFRPNVVTTSRNFYGFFRVDRTALAVTRPPEAVRRLIHGQIVHGTQFERPAAKMLPTTYFGPRSGIGLALQNLPGRIGPGSRQPIRVGVVGLGVGTLAAWGLPGDLFRFYEINPAVIQLSVGPQPVFSFLSGSRARIEVIPGDARLSLEREPPQRYDVLALDAFSSDAIPVHLLTVEAFEVYVRHLASPESVIGVHVSNRVLDLAPVVFALARRQGMSAREVCDTGEIPGTTASCWVLLSRGERVLSAPPVVKASERTAPRQERATPPWTDSFSNLLGTVRFSP